MRFFLVFVLSLFPLFAAAAEPAAECGAGKLYKIDDVPVVVVEGTWYEMGNQYGTLLKKEMNAFSQTMELGLTMLLGDERFQGFADLAESQGQLYPKRFREIHRGMSAGSGLSLRKIAILEHYLAANIAMGKGLFCSSVSVWGDFTTDGSLIMGRNFDFPAAYLQGCPYFCVTIFRPTDGTLPCATLGYAGGVGTVNVFNAQGLVAGVNIANNIPTKNESLHLDRITAPITITTLGFDCDTLTQCDAALKTYRFNFPLLCTVADASEARTYEIGTDNLLVRKPDEQGLNTVSNWAYDPDWGDIAGGEDQRRKNLQTLARQHKRQIDVVKMKEILNVKTEENGAMIPMEAVNPTSICTLHQFVFVPNKNFLSIRQPNYKKNPKWIDLDLTPFFANAN